MGLLPPLQNHTPRLPGLEVTVHQTLRTTEAYNMIPADPQIGYTPAVALARFIQVLVWFDPERNRDGFRIRAECSGAVGQTGAGRRTDRTGAASPCW